MSGDGGTAHSGSGGVPSVRVVVDVANVVGSRPDGWWKDRAGAASRLLAAMSGLAGSDVLAPDGAQVSVEQLIAVVEGAARDVAEPDGVVLVRAPRDGDDSIVSAARECLRRGDVLVVTADRGLRARLPGRVLVAGPGWLNGLLGR